MKAQDISVVLLSGGQSSRFWPLPHKMTMPIFDSSFLEKQVRQLLQAGFANLIIVGTADIDARFRSFNPNVTVVTQKGNGQGAAVISAASLITNKPVLIINADDVIDSSLFTQILAVADQKNNVLVGYKTMSYFPGGYLELDGKRIVKIHEKPGEGNEPSEYVRLVCDYFSSASTVVDALKSHRSAQADTHYEDTLSQLMKDGVTFEMVEYAGTWLPVKYPWQWLPLTDHFLQTIKKSNIHKSVRIHKSATVQGSVVLGEGVRIMEYAKLVGPLYIGKNTIVGNHTMIRSSMIGEGTVIGFGSDIARSYIGDNCWFHSNYVGDSVIADNVAMGAGACLANLRLDEGEVMSTVKNTRVNTRLSKLGAMIGRGARLGVGSQLMPGVKVGQGSVVGAGVVLEHDLDEGKRCFVKQTQMIEDVKTNFVGSRDRFRKKIV